MTQPIRSDTSALYSSDMVDSVLKLIGTNLDAEQIGSVLMAVDMLSLGDPVGSVCIDDDTGRVAVRVQTGNLIQWRVISTDGSQYNDLQATLPWRSLHNPSAGEVVVEATIDEVPVIRGVR